MSPSLVLGDGSKHTRMNAVSWGLASLAGKSAWGAPTRNPETQQGPRDSLVAGSIHLHETWEDREPDPGWPRVTNGSWQGDPQAALGSHSPGQRFSGRLSFCTDSSPGPLLCLLKKGFLGCVFEKGPSLRTWQKRPLESGDPQPAGHHCPGSGAPGARAPPPGGDTGWTLSSEPGSFQGAAGGMGSRQWLGVAPGPQVQAELWAHSFLWTWVLTPAARVLGG